MMLVRDRGGDRAMSWGGFWAIFERAAFRQHCKAADTWVGDEVRRASGGAGGRRLLEAADAWVGDKVRRASSGADGRRLLELCSRDSDNFATFSMVKTLLCYFTGVCIHGCRWIFLRGVYCV